MWTIARAVLLHCIRSPHHAEYRAADAGCKLCAQAYVLGIPTFMYYSLSNKTALPKVHAILDFYEKKANEDKAREDARLAAEKNKKKKKAKAATSAEAKADDANTAQEKSNAASNTECTQETIVLASPQPELPKEVKSFMADYSFFFLGFRKHAYWWEIVGMLRKAGVALVGVV